MSINKDGVVREAPCETCKYLLSFPICEAFPEGIPDEIRQGENQHTEPYPGDRGLQYKLFNED